MPQGNAGNIQEVIEQHIEKGVVALCAILLIVAVGHWVLSSPRLTSIYTGDGTKTEQVAPSEVDATLLAAARRVRDRAEAAQFDRPVSPEYLALIQDLRANPFDVGSPSRFSAMLPPPEPREFDDPAMLGITVEQLTQDISDLFPQEPLLPAPIVWAGRSLYQQDGQAHDTIVAHIVSDFPLDRLTQKWDQRLDDAHTETRLVVAGVVIESQSRLPDGQWAGNAPVLVSTPVFTGEGDGRKEISPPELPPYDGTNGGQVLAAIGELSAMWQGHLLRPGYWPVHDSATDEWIDWKAGFPGGVAVDDDNALWAHDVSLKPILEYRYRYRLRLINPLLTADMDVDSDLPDEAKLHYIDSQWSQWSEPVSVAGSTEFFISGIHADKKSVNITVYTVAMGERVEAEFKVRPGQLIGGLRSVPGIAEPVDFSTGATLVGIEFGARFYRGVMRLKDTRIVYMDQQGAVHTRLVKLDRAARDSQPE